MCCEICLDKQQMILRQVPYYSMIVWNETCPMSDFSEDKTNENIEEFVNRILNIGKEIEKSGNTFNDDEVAMTILKGFEPAGSSWMSPKI